ncbi:MAG: SAF domain-containing protein, partial [Chloroflexi bacterium]|nr:SAF domain-containing protein [Chloroflexota bacterium]
QPVVVASTNIAERVQVKAGDVTVKAFPGDLAPSGALTSIDQAVGKITLAAIQEGEVILPQRLAQDSKNLAPSFLVPTPESGHLGKRSWQSPPRIISPRGTAESWRSRGPH